MAKIMAKEGLSIGHKYILGKRIGGGSFGEIHIGILINP